MNNKLLRQRVALEVLLKALAEATDCGVLDNLGGYIHPDVINRFCGAVVEMQSNQLNPRG